MRILLAEDEPALATWLVQALRQSNFQVDWVNDGRLVASSLRASRYDALVLDLGLPGRDGHDVLDGLRDAGHQLPVLILTARDSLIERVDTLRAGADDFLAKPFEPEVLNLGVERAFRLHQLQAENKRLRAMQLPDALSGLLTRDPLMLNVCRTIEKVANTNASVMLLGESGTGKEILARGLHQQSNRKGGKFVAINCAAIPENLLESELFGYEKGAFTGAAKTTLGKIETAHGGTLMLDEIGDLPFPLQAKLLRFLQERVVERVGGRQEIAVNVRVVCATHQNLKQFAQDGRFREDLYYRLAEIVIDIPPLRERVGDAALLAHAFMHRFGQEHARTGLTLADDAVRAIEAHRWPGNIRELENCIKRATIMADGNQITADDIGLTVMGGGEDDRSLDLRVLRDAAEQRAVIAALARVNGNIAKAADLLGVSRPTLYDLMHKLGLKS